jgi:hypothetical protein
MKNLLEWFKSLFTKKEDIPADPHGISEFKSLIVTGLSIANEVKSAKADGKITAIEWVGIVKAAVPLINNARNWQLLKAQCLDFSTKDGHELAAYALSLGIVSDKIHDVIFHVIAAIEKGYAIYTEDVIPIINILKK